MRGTKKFQKNKQRRLKKSLRKKGGMNPGKISLKRIGNYDEISKISKEDLKKRSLFRKIANTAGIMTVGQKQEMQKKEWDMESDREGIEGYKDLKAFLIKEINERDSPPRRYKTGYISIDELNFIIESVIQIGVNPRKIEKLKPFIKDEDMIEYDGNEDEIFEILYGDQYYYIPENHPVRKKK
jgi:hypothetical protein